ncbi:hypothetical protein G3480_16150 [Thiorhodococcus mannitoliphagus]|uniref:EamA family transporter n=1 Tax=Thiorhodococcus mannitoliphagus TaxID=329406 RepID=A0A6P1E071_9GAMM|nr:hypothetical protein [Thiorhodococcus mannitoliphagus]NEX21822.1 hypothetical protein [Thiorhodococcus mannitoliphagus]
MNQPLLAMIAVICNVGAQLAIKEAGSLVERGPGILAWINPVLFLAVGLYGASFLLTVKVFAVNPLTLAAPIMAGSTFVLVGVAGAFLLGEAVSVNRVVGMGCILAGILLISQSS